MPIKFHIITNEDSVKYVDKIMEKINMTSNCDFTHTIMTLSHIIDVTNKEICPKLGTRTEFCEVLMGTMTPLLFPYLFLNLDHVVYVDRSLGKNHAIISRDFCTKIIPKQKFHDIAQLMNIIFLVCIMTKCS